MDDLTKQLNQELIALHALIETSNWGSALTGNPEETEQMLEHAQELKSLLLKDLR